MFLIRWLAGRWLLRRFLGTGGPPPRRRSSAYGMRPSRRSQRGGRLGLFGPVPYYSGRTRRGTRVSVGGCCLPVPLLLALSGLAATRQLLRPHR